MTTACLNPPGGGRQPSRGAGPHAVTGGSGVAVAANDHRMARRSTRKQDVIPAGCISRIMPCSYSLSGLWIARLTIGARRDAAADGWQRPGTQRFGAGGSPRSRTASQRLAGRRTALPVMQISAQPSACLSGGTVNQYRALRFRPLVGVLVLLLAGCGAGGTVTGAVSNSPSSESTASLSEGTASSPPTEGTGPESSPSRSDGAGGGIAISVAGLPIGDGNQEGDNSGNDECINVQWLGTISHPGVVLAVTNVIVSNPFTVVGVATAGCPQDNPACVDSKFSAADNNAGTICFAGVEYTGPPMTDPNASADGSLELVGELSCPNADSATCQRYRDEVLQAGNSSVSISFYPADTSSAPPTDTSSAPPTDTSSAPPTGTSSTAPTDTSSAPPGGHEFALTPRPDERDRRQPPWYPA